MPIVVRAIKKKKDNMVEEKIAPKKNMGMDSMTKKKKATYKSSGGKVTTSKATPKVYTGSKGPYNVDKQGMVTFPGGKIFTGR